MTPLLAHRLLRDPERSFERVYKRHVRDVYGFALSLLGNPADAEDVTQTTFLNAYRAFNRGERVENLRAWLLAIAHNVCRQRFRTASRRPQEVEFDPEVAEAFVDEAAPTAGEIRTAMSQLAFNQRTVLVLREIEGLSYEEIAAAMELSLSAVETLLFRARQALREQLEAADNDLGCEAVERLISFQLDGKLSRQDRRLLRAHLRSCGECAKFARSQRARKKVMPRLVAVPLPAGLTGAFDVGGFGVATAKLTALAVGAALVGTGALVTAGVVPVPGVGDRPAAEAATADSLDSISSVPRTFARDGRATVLPAKIRAALAPGGARGDETSKTRETPRRGKPKAGQKAGGGHALTPVSVTPVSEVVGAVQAVIDEAGSNIPVVPVSPPVEPPSLPPVNVEPPSLPSVPVEPPSLPPVPLPEVGPLP